MSNNHSAVMGDKKETINLSEKHDIQSNISTTTDKTSTMKSSQENNADVYVVDRCGIITVPTSVQQTEVASCYSLSTASSASSCVNVTLSSPGLYPELKELLSQKNASTAPSCPDYHIQEINEFLSCPNETGAHFTKIQDEHGGVEISSIVSSQLSDTGVMDQKLPSAAKPADQEPVEHPEQIVPILPEALVNGAVNVAQSAYSVACNVLNTLRPKAESDTNVSFIHLH